MDNFNKYEQNEFVICDTLSRTMTGVNNLVINPTRVKYSSLDMYLTLNAKKYACEIKCRKVQYESMILEKTKYLALYNQYLMGHQCRYINYIEDTDTLIIFKLNNRFANEWKELTFDELACPSTTASNGEFIMKKVKYISVKDTDEVIHNYSQRLKDKGIDFPYKPI